MVKVDGTSAKEIALHFLEVTEQRYTPAIISKTIVQAKNILEAGYTKEEIISSINWVINETTVKMWSLGYISTMINRILISIKEDEEEKELNENMKRYKEEMEEYKKELANKEEGESEEDVRARERNKEKASRFGNAAGLGEKHSFDMLKESGEDN